MDKLERIRQMLDAFYEGSSDIDEERLLIEFFSKENLPEEFEEEREVFQSLQTLTEAVEVPEDLESRISHTIDQAEKSEKRIRRLNLYTYSGLAAGLLIILSVYLGFIKENRPAELTQFAIEDPERAYVEARKALELVSEKWNTGTGELQSLDKVNRKIQKNLSSINKISSGSKELKLLGNLEKANDLRIQ